MDLFASMQAHSYGEVHLGVDAASGLKAIVAIHDTRLGPSLGGCRFIPYDSEDAALTDALRLARGMTYKAAITGLALGGGKSVILRPAGDFDRTALFNAFGRFVDNLGGRYITAEDSGTSTVEMDIIRNNTRHVTGVAPSRGGSGDPSPFTALGVRRGIEACVKHRFGRDSLDGTTVSLLGVGHVGYYLCRELHAAGAKLTVADIDPARAERARAEFGATVVSVDALLDVKSDVYAPCALGAGLNDATIPRLQCAIVAGAANNQLATPAHGDALMARGILYAPDYAINAGGLVNVYQETIGYDAEVSRARCMKIYDTLLEICQRSAAEKISPHIVSDRMAEERFRVVR